MERERHQPNGGDTNPNVNSYGTDDPEEQARIEQARIDARQERNSDRARLERYVEAGLRPDDAEALIEFEHYVQEQREQTAQTERATELAVAGVTPEHGATTSIEDTRTDLTDLLDLRQQPGGAAALAEFAASLRGSAGSSAAQMPSDPATVASYLAIGLDRRDALTVAGFEYFLRDKLRSAGDPAADLATELGDRAPRYQPRIYVIDRTSAEQGVTSGGWLDAAQPAEDLGAAIAAMLESAEAAGPSEWVVEATEGFAGLDLHGFADAALISRLGRGVAEHGAAFAAWVSVQGTDDHDVLDRFGLLRRQLPERTGLGGVDRR
jgi:hypothetical protein